MKTILHVQIDAYKHVRTLLSLKLASRFQSPTCSKCKSFVVFFFLPPTIVVVFTIALTDVQQQNAHFPLETHALLPHESDYITLVTSRVAAL